MPMFFLTVEVLKCCVRDVTIMNEITVCLFVFFLSRDKKSEGVIPFSWSAARISAPNRNFQFHSSQMTTRKDN